MYWNYYLALVEKIMSNLQYKETVCLSKPGQTKKSIVSSYCCIIIPFYKTKILSVLQFIVKGKNGVLSYNRWPVTFIYDKKIDVVN